MNSIEQIIEEKAAALMEIPGVVGVGQGLNHQEVECLVVMVTQATAELTDAVRSVLADCPFTLETSGEFWAGPS